ncbi:MULTISPECIES: fimbrial protein [Cysteiniphilum]|uniref:fimbrial protein n=1 Tax=Cysteiniphilum TaxID=2056696 RepID=UPI00178669F0|nr:MULTISPECIES: type 1 fimbrial protein [Cysteiniphilum]
MKNRCLYIILLSALIKLVNADNTQTIHFTFIAPAATCTVETKNVTIDFGSISPTAITQKVHTDGTVVNGVSEKKAVIKLSNCILYSQTLQVKYTPKETSQSGKNLALYTNAKTPIDSGFGVKFEDANNTNAVIDFTATNPTLNLKDDGGGNYEINLNTILIYDGNTTPSNLSGKINGALAIQMNYT